MVLAERLLHWMQLVGRGCKTLDRQDVLAIGLSGQHGARLHGLAVDMDRAGPT